MSSQSELGFNRVQVGTVPFEITSLPTAVDHVIATATAKRAIPYRLANAYCVAIASTDPQYRALLHGDGYNFPDGFPVVWTMRYLTKKDTRPGRVRGPSLFYAVLDKGHEKKLKHFFLGTTEETLQKLTSAVSERFPRAIIAGTYAPNFGHLTEEFIETCSRAVKEANPDIVWVALGSPKQDYAAAQLSLATGLPCVGVGAAFDFLAGTAIEAPKWVQNSGMEWAFRLATDPKRLWKRYLIGNAQFLKSVLSDSKRNQQCFHKTDSSDGSKHQ